MKVRVEWKLNDSASLGEALMDPRLSFRAKGILAYLFTNLRYSRFDGNRLTEASSEGKAAISTALLELEVAGCCHRIETIEGEGGSPEATRGGAPPLPSVMTSLFDGMIDVPQPEIKHGRAQRKDAPQDMPTHPAEGAVKRIIDRLNELREQSWDWAHYTPLLARYPKNVEQIKQRLSEGYTEHDLILVLEYRAAVDGGDENSRRYFNCDTPFNTKNFELNLTLAREWDARGRPSARTSQSLRFDQSHDPEIYERRLTGGKK